MPRLSTPTARIVALGFVALFATLPTFGQALILTQTSRATVFDATVALEQMLLDKDILVVDVREPLSGDDIGDLSLYQCVWDLRIDTSLSAIDETRYADYAALGGSMFFAGEWSAFDFRNFPIAQLLTGLGGGSVTTSLLGGAGTDDYPETTNAAHPMVQDCDFVGEVVYNGFDNGSFTSVGNGTPLTFDLFSTDVGAAVWDPGTLSTALDARAVFALDINWMAPAPTGTLDTRVDGLTPTQNRTLINNMITYMCGLCCQETPVPAKRTSTPLPRSEFGSLPPLGLLAPREPAEPDSDASATSCPSAPTSRTIRRAQSFFTSEEFIKAEQLKSSGRSRNSVQRTPPTWRQRGQNDERPQP